MECECMVGYPKILWNTWSLKQKIVWFFLNKLNIRRKEIELYYANLKLKENSNDKKYWYEDYPKDSIIVTLRTIESRVSFSANFITGSQKQGGKDV